MIRRYCAGVLVAALFLGCASHKYLKPEPVVSPEESGFKVLKKGEKNFPLKKGNKYVIAFPASQAENFYLVITTPEKKSLKTYFADSYLGRKGRGKEIPDESPFPDSMSVYPVDNKTAQYFWMIDQVSPEKLELHVNYRYVPRWRFRFENKHEEYTSTLEKNRIDRATYNAINETFDFSKIDFGKSIQEISSALKNITSVHRELLSIDSIFPKNILNSDDEAIRNYRALKTNLEDELAFQSSYLAAMEFFKRSLKEQSPLAAFVENATDLSAFFRDRARFSPGVLSRAKSVIAGRFDEVGPHYLAHISKKRDDRVFEQEFVKEFDNLDTLSVLSGASQPAPMQAAAGYVRSFNSAAETMQKGDAAMTALSGRIRDLKTMPDNNFYTDIAREAAAIKERIPAKLFERFSSYAGLVSTQQIDLKIADFATRASETATQYATAAALVPQLSEMFARQEYRGMLALLKQNAHLSFLLNSYKEVDRYSLNAQATTIGASIDEKNWRKAEIGLRELHEDADYLDLTAIAPAKTQQVGSLEEKLLEKIEEESIRRARAFVAANSPALDNIEVLYEDSSFTPVHVASFSSADPERLRKRQAQVADHLHNFKYTEFPATAIKDHYAALSANPDDKGVQRARAVVAHGKQYKGNDAKVKNRIAECDPYAAKWLTKPKEYRRLLALPTTNARGENTYLLRLNVRIPSEAKFPVYDINVKLPKTLAEKAAAAQWYDQIMVNKEVIKNEGRYTITSPGPSNDYECQVTPVRMLKDKDNIVEIRFKYQGLTVLPVSIMAQKPIIKKN